MPITNPVDLQIVGQHIQILTSLLNTAGTVAATDRALSAANITELNDTLAQLLAYYQSVAPSVPAAP